MNKKRLISLVSIILVVISIAAVFCVSYVSSAKDTVTYIDNSKELQQLMSQATQFILVRHKQLGGSHYAYTEAVTDERSEYNFHGGSKLCRITLEVDPENPKKVKVTEEELIKSATGVLRDPDVSEDGTKIVYSFKENSDNDDFHLYEYDLTTKKKRQLTFGMGRAVIEPVYTANGSIVFNSTRDVQTVDCWHTPVSNLYTCDADGGNITRLGYDQVHTTYPTTTSDGRVLYTRWDYNDRSQMYVQALFQMFPDGTLQTEVFGNDANNPTTLLHTREIPGSSYKYITIISGHHMHQIGKVAIVDTSLGRNERGAVSYIYKDGATNQLSAGASNEDNGLFKQGTVFKYPYAYSEDLYTMAMCKDYSGRGAAFDIVLMNEKGKTQTLVKSDGEYPASQFVPIKTREIFERSSMVNYSKDTGTYYMANVYLGEGMEGVKAGSAKYLRVVALSFRSYAIGDTFAAGTGTGDPFTPIATGNGSWDVKQVLGIVPIEEDGSALFSVPSETPVYFQVLDKNGDLIQTMRSWSTLQPGESFSCVGCHLDKNTAPQTSLGVTDAMRKGVQQLQPDLWMETCEDYKDFDPYNDEYIGFDYLSVVQPILDESCVTCHSNTEKAYSKILINKFRDGDKDRQEAETVFPTDTEWQYTKVDPGSNWYKKDFDSKSWTTDYAPFGHVGSSADAINTVWKDTNTIWLRKTVNVTQYDVEAATLQFNLANSGNITVYVNGTEVYTSASNSSYKTVTVGEQFRSAFVKGENVIAVKVTSSANSRFFALGFNAIPSSGTGTIVDTKNIFNKGSSVRYTVGSEDTLGRSGNWTSIDFDASAWKVQNTPLGKRINGENSTDWNADNPYIWIRYEFNVSNASDYANAILKLNAYYDDDVHVYLNGNEVYSHDQWNNDYTEYTLNGAAKYIVTGKNVLAVTLHQHSGGYEWDAALTADIMSGTVLSSNAPVSFENISVYGGNLGKNFPLSYMVLTGTTPAGDFEWIGNPNNSYTTFISSMSQCEILNPYAGGATKSQIIKKLRSGHCKDITDAEIAAIACWIDLCVPCYGEYDPEGQTTWGNDSERGAVEKDNKRHIYDVLDRYAKLGKAGLLKGEVKIEYGKSQSATGVGYAVLYTKRNFQLSNVITVTLPEGEKYLGLSLAPRAGEAIMYLPNGKLELKLPSAYASAAPSRLTSAVSTTIVARVVSEEELTKVYNLAYNPYDFTAFAGGFPHVESSNNPTEIISSGRSVIDGFVSNQEKGGFPSQAWEPENLKSTDHLTIQYGREVVIEELSILIRNARNDTHFTSCTVEFSNGTKMELSLKDSAHEQRFDVDSVKTTYVKFTNFQVADESKPVAITEIETLGTEVLGK